MKSSIGFLIICVLLSSLRTSFGKDFLFTESARFDGWYNNLGHPDWGSPGRPMIRESPANFHDGIRVPQSDGLPNPYTLSTILKGVSGIPSPNQRSVFFTFFGQHVGDDLLDSRWYTCPNEYVNFVIPKDERTMNLSDAERLVPVYRSRFSKNSGQSVNAPRTLTNEATSWLDGSAIYGNSHAWTSSLRSFEGGRLREEPGFPGFPSYNRQDLPLYNPVVDQAHPRKLRSPDELFGFGNPRGNENPFLVTQGIIWFRWHNALARKFGLQFPSFTDQQLFNLARRWTIATYQKVVFYDWLPHLIGRSLPAYSGYNSFLDPSVSVEFSVAALRVGHGMVPSGVVLREPDCTQMSPLPESFGNSAGEPALRLCNTYWQLQDAIVETGIEPIVLGMTSQTAEATDHVVVEDLTEFAYGFSKRTRLSVEAVTIQRGREAGISFYNDVRKAYGLEKLTNFTQLNPSLPDELIRRLSDMYNGDIDKLELYVGGMLESRDDQVGEVFALIIENQFLRTRNSDRFWFENSEQSQLNETEIEEIFSKSMRDILSEITDIAFERLQEDVFSTEGSRCPSINIQPEEYMRPCESNRGLDLFYGYWTSYAFILVFLMSFVVLAYLAVLLLARRKKRQMKDIKKRQAERVRAKEKDSPAKKKVDFNGKNFPATEIEGKKSERNVTIVLDSGRLTLFSLDGRELRKIELAEIKKSYIFISQNKAQDMMVVRLPKGYDVVLRFTDTNERTDAVENVEAYFTANSIETQLIEMDEYNLIEQAVTKEKRQQLLEAFFRRSFIKVQGDEEVTKSQAKKEKYAHTNKQIALIELTKEELAETLGMRTESTFVQQMFQFADKDKSGTLSFKEFADLVVLLMKGTPEQKAEMLFSMYDTEHTGKLSRKQGSDMIRSFLEMAGAKLSTAEVDKAVETIFKEADPEQEEDVLTLETFTYAMLKDHRKAFVSARLSISGLSEKVKNDEEVTTPVMGRKGSIEGSSANILLKRRRTIAPPDFPGKRRLSRVFSFAAPAGPEESSAAARRWKRLKRFLENNRREVLCMIVYHGIGIAVMWERAMFYAFGSEHTGLRRTTEWGLILSRSTAAGISFNYSFILLTMCRNLITAARESFLKHLIPFDAAVSFHKQVAWTAVVLAIIHSFGHLVNFWHFSVHPMPVLACLFPSIIMDDHTDLPQTIGYWFFQTMNGLTGIGLILVLSIIYVFASKYSRQYCFRYFYITHHLYSVLMVLIIFHGSLGIIQTPVFHFYLVVPLTLFVVDKMVTLSRAKIDTPVLKVEILPSNVTSLVFKKPCGFEYRSGQWIRFACPDLGSNEYHPFTLTSSPHEDFLSCHVRAIGPWTTNLRELYSNAIHQNLPLPNVYLDGPFGEGHQDWYKYKVSVLVGAGIGVTPFASILKDIVHRKSMSSQQPIACEKVYFIWVTRTQRNFEWMTDVIRSVENSKGGDLLSTHIYITQFFNKFDIRTTMLYICERYFQKISKKSMFTGLKATTHFGRPQFEPFLDSLQQIHDDVRTIGVFSCGPCGITKGVNTACKNLNKLNMARFNHFYENF